MWFLFIFVSAFFSSAATVLVKLGVKQVDTTLAAAIKTVIVTVIAWGVVILRGQAPQLASISFRTLLFLILTGLTTGGVWLCEYGALKYGDVDTLVVASRCSMVLSVILSFILLGEPFTAWSILGIALILLGTAWMVDPAKRKDRQKLSRKWGLLIIAQVVFSAMTTILGKVGISGVDSTLGTAIHSAVVLAMTGSTVLLTGRAKQLDRIPKKDLFFLVLSGVASAVTWLTYYRGLQLQLASIVAPVDKLLSGLLTVILAFFIFGERVDRRSLAALLCVGAGTVALIL